MNRIERRVAGTRPGAAVCSPGQSNNPQRAMLGGGLLFSRRQGVVRQNQVQNRKVNTNQMSALNDLKNQDGKITRLEQKINDVENHSVINISDLERRMRMQEDKINLMTDTYRKTMATMKEYIKNLKTKINDLENSKVEELVNTNKVTLNIKEKEESVEIKN
tara:strand:- start:5380 stop:5865 length:486 start_codon:yes stop_codon:yes gene_type:complete